MSLVPRVPKRGPLSSYLLLKSLPSKGQKVDIKLKDRASAHHKPGCFICTPLSPDLPVRPSKPEVFQLDGGGILLVWKPAHSSDHVTYCVQYCTEGGSERHVLGSSDQHDIIAVFYASVCSR